MTHSVVDVVARPVELSGSLIRIQVLRFARNLFALAAVALVAIAVTITAMFIVHVRTSNWVDESREISRLARTAYVLTVERQLSLLDERAEKPNATGRVARNTALRLGRVLDSLGLVTKDDPERTGRIISIREAETRLRRGFAQPSERVASADASRKRFEVLRNRLALLVLSEDARFAERKQSERDLRVATTGAVLLEILILLIVLGRIRRRVVYQTTEALHHREELELQTQRLHKQADAIMESEARFRNLVEHSPQAVALHAEGRLLYVNPACGRLLGHEDTAQLIGAPLLRFITRETASHLVDSLASLARSQTRGPTCECQFRPMNDNRLLNVEVTSVPVSYNGRASVLSILHDVTDRKQLEQQLAHQAFHDPLTNLANRVLFRDRVEHALQRAAGGDGSPAVLVIDLDNFKAVNDGLGHSAGDWLLIEVATRLVACLKPADTVARLGGDEFAVLLDDETADAAAVADSILHAFRVPFSVQGTDIVVMMSIGIASVAPEQGADEVLRNADLALYRAKAEGKACAASFEPAMHVAALRRLELEGELRQAIDGSGATGKLMLYYQPVVRMSTGRMFGFEALVRWKHPERGILEPLDFIALAEETGLVVPLGRWVLAEACRQAREWQLRYGPLLRGTGMGLMVGVNLSGRHLAQPELVDDVSAILRRSNLTPSHLVLEMTESMLVHDNRATLERLHALKSLGVRLSIDDFGTGYSSLAYLERFPVDSLKMDRSFIAGIDTSESKSPLAEAVIGLGRILGLRVVAEGIETKEQWERLRILGCALGQGFHISRPLSAEAFERLIATSAAEAKGLQAGRFPVGLSGARRTPVTGLAATG